MSNYDPKKIPDYVNAGFTLTDIYCDQFFRRTNAAYRKRKFGRGATNDVGTAVAAILGLANVESGVVSGVATSFGLADSTWRNYDESFVVSPQLSTMRSLVLAAQDKFRSDTFRNMPQDLYSARSAVVRYSGICSFLGMQGLLDQSVDQQRRNLSDAAAPPTLKEHTAGEVKAGQAAKPATATKPGNDSTDVQIPTDAQVPTVPVQQNSAQL